MKETSDPTQSETGRTQFAVPYTTRFATRLEMTEHLPTMHCTDTRGGRHHVQT